MKLIADTLSRQRRGWRKRVRERKKEEKKIIKTIEKAARTPIFPFSSPDRYGGEDGRKKGEREEEEKK